MPECQHCGKVICKGQPYNIHVSTCAKKPPKEWLEEASVDMSQKDIGDILGVGHDTIRVWQKEYGIKTNRNKRKRALVCQYCGEELDNWSAGDHIDCDKRPTDRELSRLILDGYDMFDLAAEYNAAARSVRLWVRRLGMIKEFAPMWGWDQGCKRCKKKNECAINVRRGHHALCEPPDLIMAVEMGYDLSQVRI